MLGLLDQRDHRGEWPLLTVETEVNGDSKSTNERGYPWLVRWARRAGTWPVQETWLLSALSAQYKLFTSSPYTTYFNLCVPIAQQPGHAVVQGRLSLNVCLRS
jgi:hypothetical protein